MVQAYTHVCIYHAQASQAPFVVAILAGTILAGSYMDVFVVLLTLSFRLEGRG